MFFYQLLSYLVVSVALRFRCIFSCDFQVFFRRSASVHDPEARATQGQLEASIFVISGIYQHSAPRSVMIDNRIEIHS